VERVERVLWPWQVVVVTVRALRGPASGGFLLWSYGQNRRVGGGVPRGGRGGVVVVIFSACELGSAVCIAWMEMGLIPRG
jgi:hypothetical protein